jgi:hypothetical protein
MRLSLSDNQTTRAVLAAVGLVQGFVYFLAYEFWPDDPSAAAFAVAPVFFVSVAVLIIDLSWTGSDVKRLAALTAVPTTVFTILAFWVWRQIPGSEAPYRFDDSRIPSLIFGAAMAIYVLLPFLQTYQKSGRREYPYDSLFRHSWNNLYIVGIALLLTGAFWSIIFLWYELFKLIDVTFFEDVFTSAPFVSISLTTVFGYGMALGRESERVTSIASCTANSHASASSHRTSVPGEFAIHWAAAAVGYRACFGGTVVTHRIHDPLLERRLPRRDW